jgi:tetratricopeptide (TPR) repeat protein
MVGPPDFYNGAVTRTGARAAVRKSIAALALFLACFGVVQRSHAQTTDEASNRKLVLVLPFENRSQQPNLEWIAESFPSILNQRFASAGFLPISHDERLYGLDRLGLPQTLHPSRATAYRLAAEMDADYVVLGSYSVSDGNFSAQAQVLDVRHAHMSAPMPEQNVLAKLLDVENELAWHAIREMDPAYDVPESSFLAAVSQLRLDAFEDFVRGVLATTATERIRRLEEAVKLNPDYVPAQYQLGRSYFEAQEYEKAITEFSRVPSDHPVAMQSAFYLALSYFYTGRYPQAEQTFSFIASRLPLPEVINNQGVAASRHGKGATALFQQAVAADPKDADYLFNLAVSLRRDGDYAGAMREIQAALALSPNDSEIKAVQGLIQANLRAHTTVSEHEGIEPLERLKRQFNEATVRQAAFALEEMEQAKLSSQPPAQRSVAEAADGDHYFSQGLLLEAEQAYQTALRDDDHNAAAHAGLADVRLRTGDVAAAKDEAQASLKLGQNALAFVVLGSVDLDEKNLQAAAAAVSQALALKPGDPAALQLKQALQQRGVQVP